MLLLRHLRASIQDKFCLAAGGGELSLIKMNPLRRELVCPISRDVDGRIIYVASHNLVIYADYGKGVVARSVSDGSTVWQLKEKKIDRLRLSQDGQVLIICRNDPPEVRLVSSIGGVEITRIKGVTDGFVESSNGIRAFLDLDNCIMLGPPDMLVKVGWGQFGVFSGVFCGPRLFLTGTRSQMSVYDTQERALISSHQHSEFTRCDPIGWHDEQQRLMGVIFEPNGESLTQVVTFRDDLSLDTVIFSTTLVWGASIFNGGGHVFASNGKLFNTKTGCMEAELNLM